MSPQMGGKLADAMRAPAKGNAADSVKLSSRGKEIIGKLARGDSKEIAREQDLSESTVKIHVQGTCGS